MSPMRRLFVVLPWLCLAGDLSFTPVAVTSHCAKGQWCSLPENFLSAQEAYEFALLRVNEMRQKCNGFALAPVRRQDYEVAGTVRKDMEGYSVFKILLKPLNKFVPTSVEIEVAHLHRITDLSIFQVTKVTPAACSLFSEADDAELMVPTHWKETKEAAELARRVLNEQRKILCPERPQLQLLRILAASRQPVEGKVYRLQLEFREELEHFGEESGSFEEQVLVSYALDHRVPQEMTLNPEVYSGRYPCKMVHEEKEQTALDFLNASVSIDGSHVKDSHTGFQKVLKHGFDNQMIHADAWSKLKATKYVERLKEEIFHLAVKNRQNIKICDAAQKPERAKQMLKSLEDADYELHAMCLWVPEVAIRSRGQHRSAESGRVVCSSTYASSAEATLAFAKSWDEQIRAEDPHYKSLVLLDNTPRQAMRISLEDFEVRTRWQPQEAEKHYRELRA